MAAKVDVVAELVADNPGVSEVVLAVYGDCLRTYIKAAEHVRRHGAVVAHPRTGAPLQNPSLAIADLCAARLQRYRTVKADRVRRLLEGED